MRSFDKIILITSNEQMLCILSSRRTTLFQTVYITTWNNLLIRIKSLVKYRHKSRKTCANWLDLSLRRLGYSQKGWSTSHNKIITSYRQITMENSTTFWRKQTSFMKKKWGKGIEFACLFAMDIDVVCCAF